VEFLWLVGRIRRMRLAASEGWNMSDILTTRRIWAIAVLVAALLAALAMPPAATANGRWVHSVTAGGEDDYPVTPFGDDGDGEPDFSIEASARIDADGVVQGDVVWSQTDGTVIATGQPYCLTVRDNRAYLAFVSEAGTGLGGGYLPGSAVLIAFEDGGEGTGTSDMHSYIYDAPPGYPCDGWADFVDGDPDRMVVDWLHGNVQVR
jgi:hypothetical protein